MTYNITTEFGYAKHDSGLAAYGIVVLQRFEFIRFVWGKNGFEVVADIAIV